MPTAIGLIPARAGSQRVPRKNLLELGGHPLIAYSIGAAREAGIFEAVVVSTDSEEIAETAGTLSARLRDHIAKENEVLYPMALDVLNDPHVWESMNPPLREIGPCRWSVDLFR